MGKGDIRTRRGKIWKGTYGVSRKSHFRKTTSILTKEQISNDTLNNSTTSIAKRGHLSKLVCYNCGKEFGAKDITKEHIPAKNLFEGYDGKYKLNRITVPACLKCNAYYSSIDEEFRNFIGVIARNNENQQVVGKAVRSIIRKKGSCKQRLHFDESNKVCGVEFDRNVIEEFHKKNFKGLFYHQYGTALSDDYELLVQIIDENTSESIIRMYEYLKKSFTWKFSGHKDILSYIIQPIRIDISNPNKEDLIPFKDEKMFGGILVYNKEHYVIIIARKKQFLK